MHGWLKCHSVYVYILQNMQRVDTPLCLREPIFHEVRKVHYKTTIFLFFQVRHLLAEMSFFCPFSSMTKTLCAAEILRMDSRGHVSAKPGKCAAPHDGSR